MQHKNIHITTDIIINAPVKKVWKVLANLEKWPLWTTLILRAKGEIKKDNTLALEFISPKGGSIVFERTIFLFEEGKSFGWTGTASPGLSDFHVFELEALSNSETLFTQSDGLHGADVPEARAMEKQMLIGYQWFNQELKMFVEANLQ